MNKLSKALRTLALAGALGLPFVVGCDSGSGTAEAPIQYKSVALEELANSPKTHENTFVEVVGQPSAIQPLIVLPNADKYRALLNAVLCSETSRLSCTYHQGNATIDDLAAINEVTAELSQHVNKDKIKVGGKFSKGHLNIKYIESADGRFEFPLRYNEKKSVIIGEVLDVRVYKSGGATAATANNLYTFTILPFNAKTGEEKLVIFSETKDQAESYLHKKVATEVVEAAYPCMYQGKKIWLDTTPTPSDANQPHN